VLHRKAASGNRANTSAASALHRTAAFLRPVSLVCTIAAFCAVVGCTSKSDEKDNRSAEESRTSVRKDDVLVFPDELRLEDDAVNEYVRNAMKTCAAGDYELFRLLFSARDEVLPREEFEKGWQAVREIRVTRLQKVMLAPDEKQGRAANETVYALLADVSLDPEHPAARNEPKREVALMIVREHDEWKLAKAPRAMREWLRKPSLDMPPVVPTASNGSAPP
jgi:hypothetical protein